MQMTKKHLSLFDVLAIAKATGVDGNIKRINLSEVSDLETCASSKGFVLTNGLRNTILTYFSDGKDYAYIILGSNYYITQSYDYATRFAIKKALIDMLDKDANFTF